MTRKHIAMLVTNELFPDDIRVFKEASTLAKSYQVSVVVWDRSGKLDNEVDVDGIKVHRIKSKSSYENPLSFILKLPFFWFLSLLVLLKLKADAVHCHDLDTLPVGCFLKLISPRTTVVFDSHEHYPSMVSGSIPYFLEKVVSVLFITLPTLVDGVIVVNSYLTEYFKRCRNVIVIMNTPAYADNQSEFVTSDNQFRVLYFGELCKERGIKFLLDLAAKLPIIELTIAGNGPENALVTNYSRRHKNIKFLGWVKCPRILEELRNTNLVPILYSSTILNNRIATPNKLFLAMQFGKPVVVYKDTLASQIVEKEKIGFSISESSIGELEDGISKLRMDNSVLNAISVNGKSAFRREYNWDVMADRLTDFYECLLDD